MILRKLAVLCLALTGFFSSGFSQPTSESIQNCQNKGGACYTNPNQANGPQTPSPQNGSGSLGNIFNMNKCGLNYVHAQRVLWKRGTTNPPIVGANQPATFTITGIPVCKTIERAYVWSSMSGTVTAFNITIVNPLAQSFTFPAVNIGAGADKCWGYGGTTSYRVDVTSAIAGTGNGNYLLSGFPTNPPTPQKDTDGAALMIIYSDPTAAYEGHLYINDGCCIQIGGTNTQIMSGFNACAASTFGRAFALFGDLQPAFSTGGSQTLANTPNPTYTMGMFDWQEVACNVAAAQNTATYSHFGPSDCFNFMMMGLYYRTTTCTTCPLTSALTLTTTIVPATCSLCNGQATVTASGGTPPYTYSWSTVPVQTNATATGLCAGTYTVTVTDATGCLSATTTVTITSAGGLLVLTPTITNVLCNGACTGSILINASNGTPPYTYLWNTVPAQTGQTATGLCAGTYSVVVTDANGCTSTGSYTVTQPPPLTINAAGFPTLCNGNCTGQAIVIPGGGTPGYTFNWMPGNITTASANGLCAGTYTITITDANGCTMTDTAIVLTPTPITATTSFDTSHCGLPDGLACAVASGGTGPYTYVWNSVPAQNTSCATGLIAGVYCCTITDFNACTFNICVTVPAALGVVANITGSTNVTCFGACNGDATVTGTGGVGPYTYSWNTVPVQNTQTATGLCAGTYIATITDFNGCIATATVTITQPTQLTLVAGPPATICIGQCTTLTATASGGTAPYTITWAPGGPNVCPTVTTVYTVSVTDANGCTATPQTIVVTVSPPLNVTATVAPNPICIGFSTTLSALGSGGSGTGYTYTWTPGNMNGPTVNVTPTTTGTTTYTVTLTDNCGTPAATATVTVTVNPSPAIVFTSADSAGCAPFCTLFTDATTGGAAWSWSFQGGTPATSTTSPSGQICWTVPGSYSVTLTVTDNNSCTSTVTVPNMITVHPNPVAAFTPTPNSASILNPTICFTDNSVNAATWLWDFGDPQDQFNSSTLQSPCHNYSDTGIYCVKQVVTSANGCPDSITICVYILPDFTFYVPNAFTPDGDGTNDFFFPKGEGIDENKFEMWIYDRWGNMIWTTQIWGNKWDGKANGGKKIAQEDVYVWKINVYDILGKKHSFVGHVSLIK